MLNQEQQAYIKSQDVSFSKLGELFEAQFPDFDTHQFRQWMKADYQVSYTLGAALYWAIGQLTSKDFEQQLEKYNNYLATASRCEVCEEILDNSKCNFCGSLSTQYQY